MKTLFTALILCILSRPIMAQNLLPNAEVYEYSDGHIGVNYEGQYTEYYPDNGSGGSRRPYYPPRRHPSQPRIPSCGGCNTFGCYVQNGGCNTFGCYDVGGGCNTFGCYTPNGGCNTFGCWYAGGSCNTFGCQREASKDAGRMSTRPTCR